MQGNQFKYDNLSVNLNIISSFQFSSMVKIRSFGKKKNASTSQFLFQLFYYSELLFLPSVLFCFVVFLLLFFFFYVFPGNFSYYCFLFSIFLLQFFLLKTPRGLFPLWSSIMNKYYTAIASVDAQSHIWAVLMSLDLFSLFNTDILRPTALAIITIYHLILLPFFILSKTL